MRFNHLQASIDNNRDQEPSLYMALCMVESLFWDMEDSCGQELSGCPVGSEQLATKLSWLCRTINGIYAGKNEDLQRNRSRLDAAMAKLQATHTDLEVLSSQAQQLATLRQEQAQLDQQLQAATAQAQECETLRARCLEAKQQLATLAQFDPAAARQQLQALATQIHTQEAAKAALATELAQAQATAGQLQAANAQANAQLQSLEDANRALEASLKQSGEKNTQLEQANRHLEEELAGTMRLQEDLVLTRRNLTVELEDRRRLIAAFQEENLAPLQAELDLARERVKTLEESKQAIVKERELLESQRSQLIIDIAHGQKEKEAASEKLQISQRKLEPLRQEKQRLHSALADCVEELSTLQTEVERLKTQAIPEAEALQKQEQQRRDTLQADVDRCTHQCDVYQSEIGKLEAQLPQLEKAVQSERVVYDALTASCTASSKELESLERQNAELRNNKDEEKLVIYRKQLEDTQRHLEQVQLECAQLESDNAQKQKQLEEGQNERARLLELQNRYNSGKEVTARQLQELAFAGTPGFLQEVTRLEERVKLLELVRKNLSASVANMRKILGSAPVDEKISLETQMREDLRDLQHKLEDLRSTIVDCAKSINMEVK